MSTLQLVAGHQNAILDAAAGANVAAAQAQADGPGRPPPPRRPPTTTSPPSRPTCRSRSREYQAVYDRLSAAEKRAAAAAGAGPSRASRAHARAVAASGPVVASSDAAQIAVDTAMAQRGKPYVWAAAGPGSFDCSGLIAVRLRARPASTSRTPAPCSRRMGQAVSRADLQPGDLVFFYSPVSHVGIYIGNGQMVHAPTTGDVVKVASLDSDGRFRRGTAHRRLRLDGTALCENTAL